MADKYQGNDDLSLPKGKHIPASPAFLHRPRTSQLPSSLLPGYLTNTYFSFLIVATVQKIITEILSTTASSPPSESTITFARDARDLLIDCCVEFITLISSEANEIAEREAKKTIATEHIDKALKELGFPEYVREVLASAGEMKESLKVMILFLFSYRRGVGGKQSRVGTGRIL